MTRLLLTRDAVELRFTDEGLRTIERTVRETLAPTSLATPSPATSSDRQTAVGAAASTQAMAHASAEGAIAGVRGMRMRFPVRDIVSATVSGDSLTFRMRPAAGAPPAGGPPIAGTSADTTPTGAPANASRRRRGNRGEVVYQDVRADEARAFVAALSELTRTSAPGPWTL